MYVKGPYEAKYQYLSNKREGVGIYHFNDPKAFIENSNDMHELYKNIDEYNPDKENKILIVFDDLIAYMIHNKKLDSVVTELFIRGRRLNISLVFISQSYFKIPKDVRLNTTRECTAEPYSFFVHDATLALNNPLKLRKTFLT